MHESGTRVLTDGLPPGEITQHLVHQLLLCLALRTHHSWRRWNWSQQGWQHGRNQKGQMPGGREPGQLTVATATCAPAGGVGSGMLPTCISPNLPCRASGLCLSYAGIQALPAPGEIHLCSTDPWGCAVSKDKIKQAP